MLLVPVDARVGKCRCGRGRDSGDKDGDYGYDKDGDYGYDKDGDREKDGDHGYARDCGCGCGHYRARGVEKATLDASHGRSRQRPVSAATRRVYAANDRAASLARRAGLGHWRAGVVAAARSPVPEPEPEPGSRRTIDLASYLDLARAAASTPDCRLVEVRLSPLYHEDALQRLEARLKACVPDSKVRWVLPDEADDDEVAHFDFANDADASDSEREDGGGD